MDEQNLPKHIAIIMDGNRRWANKRNLPIKLGHKNGADTLEKIVKHANKIGIKYLTVYAFSTENWKRSEEEVNALMGLLETYLNNFSKTADTENIRIRVLGKIEEFSQDLQNSIYNTMERTENNNGLVFNIALNYGGREEIIKAVKEISNEVKNNKLNIQDIDEKIFEKYLYTVNCPDPDLLIRTSGELRLSGFLLWQTTYSEFLFFDKLWPDFEEKDLDYAILEYQKRNRRFGAK